MLRRASKLIVLISLAVIVGALGLGSDLASAQQADVESTIQDLIINGGFEGGFQADFGIGYGWGGFSNGNAEVGWNFDDWQEVVTEGQYAQRIEIRNSTEIDRYAGIFQTVAVVPGQQYKLTIKGMIRSSEGDINASDYGYRLQYAVDPNGGTAWELVDGSAWQELPWDEQPMSDTEAGAFRHESYQTTVTATGDTLTLFIRGWKKWLNNGSGVYNIDAVSLVGPAPEGFQAPVAQAAAVDSPNQEVAAEIPADSSSPASAADDSVQDEAVLEVEQQLQSRTSVEAVEPVEDIMATEFDAPAESGSSAGSTSSSMIVSSVRPLAAPNTEIAPLPVSGQGSDNSINFVVIMGAVILLVLLVGAVTATIRRRHLA